MTTQLEDGQIGTWDTLEDLEKLKTRPPWNRRNYDDLRLLLITSLSEILGCFDEESNTDEGYAYFDFQVIEEGIWDSKFEFIRGVGWVDGVGSAEALLEQIEYRIREYGHLEWQLTANRHYEFGSWVCIRKFVEGRLL